MQAGRDAVRPVPERRESVTGIGHAEGKAYISRLYGEGCPQLAASAPQAAGPKLQGPDGILGLGAVRFPSPGPDIRGKLASPGVP